MREDESDSLIQRFEDQIRLNQSGFFDVDELEEIADYYLETGQLQRALLAIDLGGICTPMRPPLRSSAPATSSLPTSWIWPKKPFNMPKSSRPTTLIWSGYADNG